MCEWVTVGAWTAYSLNTTNTTHQQHFITKRWASWEKTLYVWWVWVGMIYLVPRAYHVWRYTCQVRQLNKT